MYPQPHTPIMPEKDLVFAVLADQKRVAKEYATAVTESNCEMVRQTFATLLQDTLQLQEQTYNLMKQQGWYNTPSKALRQDIDKRLQNYAQTQQQTQQLLQQQGGTLPVYQPMMGQMYQPSIHQPLA
jgi:spore coat protein F